jgi:lysozyme family protein
MAEFTQAFQKTVGHEGGYVFDRDDAGGETYRGISRRWFPDWEGWRIIDNSKKQANNFPASLDYDKLLQSLVATFYKEHFWNRFSGDKIKKQAIADELFDTAVNMSLRDSVMFLQTALNILNRNGSLFSDTVVDGLLGPTTLKCLNIILKIGDVSTLLKIMNVLQGNHYITYMSKSPTQEKYCRGWFNRVEITKA